MESTLGDLPPDLVLSPEHLGLVDGWLQGRPGARPALLAAARQDPEGVTTSVVALGAVLLDIAAGAFGLAPEQMLAKVGEGVAVGRPGWIPQQGGEG